jgi:hypothetical protein
MNKSLFLLLGSIIASKYFTRKAPSATAEPLLAEKSWIANVE